MFSAYEGPSMYLQTGGGGKGNRQQSTQNINQQQQQHHQNPQQQQQQQHLQLHQAARNAQQDHQQLNQTVFVQPNNPTVSNNQNSNHHPLPQRDQRDIQRETNNGINGSQQQQQQQQQQHPIPQPVIIYTNQPIQAQHFIGAAAGLNRDNNVLGLPTNGNNGAGGGNNGGPQQPSGSLNLGNGVQTPNSNSNTNLVRALSNSGIPHFAQSAGLMTPSPGNVGATASSFVANAYLPYNSQLIGTPAMGFPPIPNGPQMATGFFAAGPQQQKHNAVGGGAAGPPQPTQPPTIGYYHPALVAATVATNNANSSNRNMRPQHGGTPQHPNYFGTYSMAGSAPQRATIINAATAAVPPMINARNAALNASAAFHMQAGPPPFCSPIPMGAQSGLIAPPGAPPPVGMHPYATHIQAPPNPGVGGGLPVSGGYSNTSLVSQSAGQLLKEKVKERRHAIPIIHPDTMENVLDPKSSVFVKKEPSSSSVTPSLESEDNNVTMCLYQGASLTIEENIGPQLLSTTMVDHQMQTEKPLLSEAPMSLPPTTDETQISIIVKDILANSGKSSIAGHTDKPHLNYWENDADNAENRTNVVSYGRSELNAASPDLKPMAGAVEEPVIFKQQFGAKKQRPKSANKTSTATPTSIANAVAEAAANSGKTITILARPQSLSQLQPVPKMSPLPQRQSKIMKSIATTAAPSVAPTVTETSTISAGGSVSLSGLDSSNSKWPAGGSEATSPVKANAKQMPTPSSSPAKQSLSVGQSSKGQQQQQQHQPQSSTTSSSAATSSTGSTPTHQVNQQKQQLPFHQQQQQQQHQPQRGGGNNNCSKFKAAVNAATATLSPAVALLAGVAATTSNSYTNAGNKKAQRKAQKRAKEQEKKKQKAPIMVISNSSNNLKHLNNNNNNNNNGKANTSTTFATTTKTTAAAVMSTPMDKKATKQMTDKLSAPSYSSTLSNTLRDNAKQPNTSKECTPTEPEPSSLNSNGAGNKQLNAPQNIFETKPVELLSPSALDSMKLPTTQDGEKDNKILHLGNQDIMNKFLNTSDTSALGMQQLQFLNSSSSICEDSNLLPNDIESSMNEYKFPDSSASDDKSHGSDYITSATFSNSTHHLANEPSTETLVNILKATSQHSIDSADNVDCATPNNSTECVNIASSDSIKGSPEPDGRGSASPASNEITAKTAALSDTTETILEKEQPAEGSATAETATSDTSKFYRYSIDELREISKSSESRNTPMVLCQRGDCIAQLFVPRQQHHHGHTGHGQQQYQHSNYNDSNDYMPGKRSRGHGHGQNKKHHDQMNINNNSGGGSGNCGGSTSNQRHMDIIRVQLSLKEEIKLSECENAWQPETLRRVSMVSASDEDDDIESVIKKVRGILNKLTPDNFEVLLKEMSSIKIDNESKMTNVMLLIFEKTISEPNFAPTYARFCKVLFHEIKAENKSLFTSSLITRIQHEFESNVNDANAKAKKLQPTVDRMNECTDPNKKSELRAEMEDLEYQFRRRAWGTVRFIGELFKLQSLTSDRVLHCIESLLEHGCEEKLEYMCKLLTTVGHLLEGNFPDHYQNNARIEKIFRRIQDIVQRSRGNSHRQASIKLSSRVRFMMQDVLDLRARNWDQPGSGHSGRQRHNSGTGKQHEDKQYNRGATNVNTGGGQHHQKQQHHQIGGRHQEVHIHDTGNYFMHKLPKPQQAECQSVSIDPAKLRFSSGDEATAGMPKLGNPSQYQWRNTSNRPVSAPAPAATTNVSKRAPVQPASHTITYSPYQKGKMGNFPAAGQTNAANNKPRAEDPVEFTSKQCQELLTQLLEEALNTRDWKPEVLGMWSSCHTKQQADVFYHLLMDYLHRAHVSRKQRLAFANIFTHLMRQSAFDKSTFGQIYRRFAEDFPDLLVDVPNGWTYIFDFLGPIMHERLLNLSDVWQRTWLDDDFIAERFVRAFLNYFVNEFGVSYTRDLWHKEYKLDRGQVFWKDAFKYREFINVNNFTFLEQSPKHQLYQQPRTKVTRTPIEHVDRIAFFLNSSNNCDIAIDYINTNVHVDTDFIRQLTKFLCCDFALTVITTNNNNKQVSKKPLQLNTQNFRQMCMPLLRLCIDAKETHEIACIDETVDSLQQHFMTEMEDEMAAGETICTAFNVLYDSDVIPKESFDKWYKLEMEHSSAYRRPFIDKLRIFIEDLF